MKLLERKCGLRFGRGAPHPKTEPGTQALLEVKRELIETQRASALAFIHHAKYMAVNGVSLEKGWMYSMTV